MAIMARNIAIMPRQSAEESGSFTVTIDCETGNEYDGRVGLRVSAIFVIFIGSMLGCIVPLLLARFSRKPGFKLVFFAAKFFGSGVIISTAFIHLLAPAIASLYSPCLNPDSPITEYAWPEGICLMSVFAMFLAELVVNHYAARVDERTAAFREPEHGRVQESSKNNQLERPESGKSVYTA
jgi:zinc transporter 1/2/3